jgi:hypothetical protein
MASGYLRRTKIKPPGLAKADSRNGPAKVDAEPFHQSPGKMGRLRLGRCGWEPAIGANGRRHQGYRNDMPGVSHQFRGFNIVQDYFYVKLGQKVAVDIMVIALNRAIALYWGVPGNL